MKKIRKFWNENKVKATIMCSVCSLTIVGSVVAGTVLSSTYSHKSNSSPKLEQIATPGELKFDEKGQILIPKIDDPENPSGVYENKLPEIKEQVTPPEILNAEFNKTKLNDILKDNKKKIFESIDGDLQQEVKVDTKLKMYINNIIPNNNVEIDSNISVENLISNLYDTSTNNAKKQILTTQKISDLLALNNINYAKEYNAAFTTNDIEQQPTIFGGGGVNPPKPPHVDTDFPENIILNDACTIYEQDTQIRYGFAITYSALLPILTVTSGIAAFFTFGISLAIAAIDIVFCAIEIANAWNEYDHSQAITYDLKEAAIDYGWDNFKAWKVKNFDKLPHIKKLQENIIYKNLKYVKEIAKNYKTILGYITIFSIAVKVTMVTLEKLLLKYL